MIKYYIYLQMKWFVLILIVVVLAFTACHSESLPPVQVQVQGSVVIRGIDSLASDRYPEGVAVRVLSDRGELLGEAQTNRVGQYQVAIADANVGDELLVRVEYVDAGTQLVLKAAKRAKVNKDRHAYVPQMVLVDPGDAELERYQDTWYDSSGDVTVEDPQNRFSHIWARAFDPEFDRPFFPGNYRDADGNKIISNGFLFITAQDASGQQVTALDEPVTVYFYIPNTHRFYLVDITPDNGLYEVPMYLYDEVRDTWVRKGTGVLVDFYHQPVPESDEQQITTDPYYGDLFVKFQADHFSTWNVDYPLPPCNR